MLTDEDIKKLVEVFATREEINDRFELTVTKQELSNLVNAVDAYARKVDTYAKEMAAMANAIRRHETWIKLLAEKLGVNLEY